MDVTQQLLLKIEAVKQVTEKGHSVAEVAARLGTTTHSLYAWIKRYDPQQEEIAMIMLLLRASFSC